ncbi:uncharacterized protein [Zea mays]|uniref:uncharacterized protein isoform X2 n=1 Tax=Zea mays TaxID=4577 RepID=UPI0004DE924E|nr:uncharacterized protein LOC100279920 isoform X2 [Zea mays]XP_008665417.1 uncharacterized protein LOC103644007 isoform X2 [Zea mays]|eukprot:XP_008651361.1 uncharacterized protein LOC100279920 isoform X2 [Zea mays]
MQIFSRRKNECVSGRMLYKSEYKFSTIVQTESIRLHILSIQQTKLVIFRMQAKCDAATEDHAHSVRAIGLERTCGKPISDLASFRFPHCRHTRVQPATNAPAGDWSLDPVCFVGKLQAPLDGRRLEPRSSLLCWKTSSTTRRKLSALKIRTRRSRALTRLALCGRCISVRSPR